MNIMTRSGRTFTVTVTEAKGDTAATAAEWHDILDVMRHLVDQGTVRVKTS